MATALMEPGFPIDRLNYEIFSILESKFLFGYDDSKHVHSSPIPQTPRRSTAGRVRVLSIDGGGAASDGLLAAAALAKLEIHLQAQSADPAARIADYFDVAAGSGAGGVLAAMLFTKGPAGRPLFSAEDALHYLARYRGKLSSHKKGLLRGIFRRSGGGRLRRLFGDASLKDTIKPVLITCYDLSTGAPFVFSRADAVESDGFDFRLREVCAATCADAAAGIAAVEMRSLDGRTRIAAVGGGLAMGNPTAAAITHVLNNKQEFPFAAGVEDLIVVSLGGGEAEAGGRYSAPPSAAELVRIAGEGVADMVDQAVAMSFGENRTNNYVRIQGNGIGLGTRAQTPRSMSAASDVRKVVAAAAAEVLAQRNIESILFRGKKILEQSNEERLAWFSVELVKEQERRKKSLIPTVVVKQALSPRSSSATMSTVMTTGTTTTYSSSRASTSPRGF